ncbi:hydroxyacid dehydrogenase [Saliterribacillus persicus]|uniref:Phosphoglycerate dehydrogenase-like enzyme n=1 Tax=Saliterribacillus persicus TaxID=930114 RepID=A0A368Y3B1_9BACI|nr:hydroxyacid dehydrogenase [Saliterribacillus persicus]RCW74761.1 phosphoglycerate dehydrogenase-like enzyme [Saliterribacillus persicus]
MTKAILVMNEDTRDLVYPSFIREEIEQQVDLVKEPITKNELIKNLSILEEVEVMLSGWGGPKLDQELLDAAPNLKAFLYAAGSIKNNATEEAWDRGILFSTAVHANGLPVAEFTLSQILFCLKNGWQFVRNIRNSKTFPQKPFQIKGGFRSKIGLISLSTVGRHTLELLRPFDMDIFVFDPFVKEEEAKKLGVRLCSLEEIFKQADVVSLHTPLLQETVGMVTGEHFQMMKEGASFINTARGAIVKEKEMLEVLKKRTDITAVLDVTDPEPPSEDSPFYTMDNVVITPHLAGSEGEECGRMGAYMLEELKRYVNAEPLKWQITKDQFDRMA